MAPKQCIDMPKQNVPKAIGSINIHRLDNLSAASQRQAAARSAGIDGEYPRSTLRHLVTLITRSIA